MLFYFFQTFSNHPFLMKIYFFVVIFIYKGSIFVILFRFFSYFFHYLTQLSSVSKAFIILFIDGIYFCFFNFYQIRSPYMIHHYLDLFYEIYNIWINIIQDKLTTFYWFQIILVSIFKCIKKVFYNFICFIIHHFLNALHALHNYLWKK